MVAFSEAPLANWLQIVALCGLIEYTGFTFTLRRSIGLMTAKWYALLACSRLAMMAIIWIFFQDGFTSPAAEFANTGSRESFWQRGAAKSKQGK